MFSNNQTAQDYSKLILLEKFGVDIPKILSLDPKERQDILTNHISVIELIKFGVEFAKILSLDSKERQHILTNHISVIELIKVGVEFPKILNLDSEERRHILTNHISVIELIKVGIKFTKILELQSELKNFLIENGSQFVCFLTNWDVSPQLLCNSNLENLKYIINIIQNCNKINSSSPLIRTLSPEEKVFIFIHAFQINILLVFGIALHEIIRLNKDGIAFAIDNISKINTYEKHRKLLGSNISVVDVLCSGSVGRDKLLAMEEAYTEQQEIALTKELIALVKSKKAQLASHFIISSVEKEVYLDYLSVQSIVGFLSAQDTKNLLEASYSDQEDFAESNEKTQQTTLSRSLRF